MYLPDQVTFLTNSEKFRMGLLLPLSHAAEKEKELKALHTLGQVMNTNDHIDMMWDIKVSSFDTVWQSWLSVYVQHLRQKWWKAR